MEYKLLSSIFYSDNSKYEDLYKSRLNSESTYKFNFKINEYDAFVVINHDILKRAQTIMELDRDLLETMHSVPQIALDQYRKRCLIDEIKMTNEIEGVNSTRKEINDILNDITEKNKRKRLYGLVKKYELLIDEEIKLTECEDIRKLYNELVLKDVVDEDSKNEPDGTIFRKDKVYVQNPSGKTIHNGTYPEDKIIREMSSGLNILNNEDYNYLIRIAVFHYIFGYIHPFYDGNGRTSRFISSYLLSRKLQILVSYRLSYTIKENIGSYYKSFKEANDEKNRGDLTIFVIKFFDMLIKSLQDLCGSLEEKDLKLNYFGDISNRVCKQDEKKSSILYILIQNTLFGEIGLSVEELSEISETGMSKVRSSLKELEEKEILYITKDGRKKLYDVNLDAMSKLDLQYEKPN
ncbi:Fic family protein [Clostridium estertheticum]|uniref:Fic family protein n=1 Tax=Clostridium estertheticum TaxID=238834 RepID=UPI001CF39832|nr:Fic family protein [Clostridium estertheticum]MCB2307383.1 Fic family protein [Clostridium estertheticum]MCB2345033.1 Fic family protein [Clostridium estertheticum]MCB2349807.1 Fic family protein [Clostridium estertheticum]WAG48069.1 Fic family protein [Clostridium estertheticum]